MSLTTAISSKANKNADDKSIEDAKLHFDNYIGFNKQVRQITENQILAMERAEDLGLITIKIEIDLNEAKLVHPYTKEVAGKIHGKMKEIFEKAVIYTVSKFFVPRIQRATRRHLSNKAQNAAIQCFATNIKQLFCQKGINDRFVLALDPGFLTCKCAFLEPTGKIITTCEFRYQQGKAGGFDRKGTEYITHCLKMTNGMNLAIAIGNGKGSYETQKIVSQLISSTLKYNKIDIGFCIVPEDGASKYSITELAAIEMPEISPNERSAVSIGRRLIDPMSEYVKIEPRHLGKGMYQHSVNSTKLTEALELVVKERVSLRGVDVNCASEHLLRQVCGLNKRTAAGIVTLREKLGKITSREEIRKVAGLGPISFVQCSGFLRVLKPEKSYVKNGNKRRKVEWNPLDETVIHPDDYGIAEKVLKKIGILTMEEEICWQDVKKKIANIGRNVKWEEGEQKIVDLLLIEEDLIEPPRLMKCVTKNVELRKGAILPGIIRNQTTFGVFVDIGLETNGLAHISKFRYRNQLPAVGQNLNFRVLDFGNGRISLEPVY
ncbi:unnamed protein product [Caenorhabditis angaria]|uniref:S1 motif domain-containing protein n=1 Tax=Caenorhabditis angaria TaxID=860376 RepID=A0A9P1MUM7_9PELO|nr:unnamed protein product [Caenorhabditis angaria]